MKEYIMLKIMLMKEKINFKETMIKLLIIGIIIPKKISLKNIIKKKMKIFKK